MALRPVRDLTASSVYFWLYPWGQYHQLDSVFIYSYYFLLLKVPSLYISTDFYLAFSEAQLQCYLYYKAFPSSPELVFLYVYFMFYES